MRSLRCRFLVRLVSLGVQKQLQHCVRTLSRLFPVRAWGPELISSLLSTAGVTVGFCNHCAWEPGRRCLLDSWPNLFGELRSRIAEGETCCQPLASTHMPAHPYMFLQSYNWFDLDDVLCTSLQSSEFMSAIAMPCQEDSVLQQSFTFSSGSP